MSLIGKKILMVGGNGFTGNYFASRLVRQSANVTSLSRKGLKYDYSENPQINWIIGDILEPAKYKQQINSADIIIHTIGTLIDTSVTKGTPQGGKGTYEQVNRDTFRSLLQSIEQPKKIIYLSSNNHPPFLRRYLDTKLEAEQLLFNSGHEGYSLRPGFIFSWQHRKWSIPLKHSIDVWNRAYPLLEKIIPSQTSLEKWMSEFKQGQSTSLEELGDAIILLCCQGHAKRIIENEDIHDLSLKFQKKGLLR